MKWLLTRVLQWLDFIRNTVSRKHIFYITEGAEWAIYWVGRNIQVHLSNPRDFRITRVSRGVRQKVIHFGSINTIKSVEHLKTLAQRNRIVVTWFHIAPGDPHLVWVKEMNALIDVFITSNTLTRNQLLERGVDSEKVRIIPIGVDLSIFRPASADERAAIRQRLGIQEGTFVIGSFQKDGNGFGEGLNPKMIKGPDVFCDVVEELVKKVPVHVLLTGPARGYVRKRFEKAQIPYTHRLLGHYHEVVPFYNALDLYLITSREEGGPQGIMESMATKTPLVSTRVGMAPDVLRDGENALLADIDDREGLIRACERVLCEPELKTSLAVNAFRDVKKLGWDIVATRYHQEVYQPLLERLYDRRLV